MAKTRRVQNNNIMSEIQKSEYIKTIVDMPWFYKPILDEISKHSNNISSILDVGCGNGFLLGLIHERYPHLSLKGIDIDVYFINKAREAFPFDFYVMDGYSFKQKGDLLISNLALHHFEEPVKFIRNLIKNANYGVIISDHIRPDEEKDLEERLEKRQKFHDFSRSEYYKVRGRENILEAYSKEEMESLFKQIDIPGKLEFFNEDYFERFVIYFPTAN